MRRTNNDQINTKTYWDFIYGDVWKRARYDAQGTLVEMGHVGDKVVRPTKRFIQTLNYIKDGDKVIDLGCGVGTMTKMIKEKYPACEVWGVDISEIVIEDNRKEHSGIQYYPGYIGNLSFLPKDYFDLVFCGEVIEHIDNPQEAFTDAYRILKPGGKLIITTPIEDHVYSEEHVWEFTREDLEKLYKDNNFKNIEFVSLADLEHLVVFYVIGEK